MPHLPLGPGDGRLDVRPAASGCGPEASAFTARATPSLGEKEGLEEDESSEFRGQSSGMRSPSRSAFCLLPSDISSLTSGPWLARSLHESRTTSSVIRNCSIASAMPAGGISVSSTALLAEQLLRGSRRGRRLLASCRTWRTAAWARKGESRGMPSFSASSSAVAKPTPQMSVLSRYGFAFTISMAFSPYVL